MHNLCKCFSFLLPAFLIFCLLGLSSQSLYASCPKPLALVIGNGDYEYRNLNHVINNASELAKMLKQIGFEVIHKNNIEYKQQMDVVVNNFVNRLNDHKERVGLFYFAGHSTQTNRKNFLLPTKNKQTHQGNLGGEDARAVKTDEILRKMREKRNGFNIIILDACYANPYPKSTQHNRCGLKNLGDSNYRKNSIIAYATDIPKLEHSSLFTESLIKELPKGILSRINVIDLFRQIAEDGFPPILSIEEDFFLGSWKCSTLNVRSNVDNATVVIQRNGKDEKKHGYVQNGELNIKLPEGWYTMGIEKSGYSPYDVSFYLQKTVEIKAVLKKPLKKPVVKLTQKKKSAQKIKLWVHSNVDGATVLINNVDGATVFINEREYGIIQNRKMSVTLPVGKYTVRVEKSGYNPFKKQIDLRNTQEVNAYLIVLGNFN